MFFTRNYDNKRIDVDELVDEYIKELKKNQNDYNNDNEVELSFVEDDDWILDDK
jgi:hypothetical protein